MRMRWAGCVALGLVGGLVGGGLMARLARPAQAADPPRFAKVMDVQGLNIVDEKGERRATLAAAGGFVTLLMFDGKGKPRLEVGVNKFGQPQVTVQDAKGMSGATMAVGDEGPLVFLRDSGGAPRLELSVTPDKVAALRHYVPDDTKQARAIFASLKNGKCALLFLDAKGKALWVAP